MPVEGDITALLTALREGDRDALDRLFPLVYRELHDRAHRQLARRRPGETLSTTALVHEAYLKLTDSAHQTYNDRVHFFAVASRAMRQILVDYARRSTAAKRGGYPVSLDPDAIGDPGRAEDLLALDEALTQLERLDERLARIVELRFFGGLSVEETSDALAISPRTVKRDWRKARAFLYQAIQGRRHRPRGRGPTRTVRVAPPT
jgi:RNA polymerase sigma factor (TIGR02999 family)